MIGKNYTEPHISNCRPMVIEISFVKEKKFKLIERFPL